MKTRLFLTLLFFSHLSIGQDTLMTDSLREKIQFFNDSITQIIEQYESDGIDFIAIRSNVKYGPSCRFIVRKDSCSSMFTFSMGDKSIQCINVTNIQSRRRHNDERVCDKELDKMYHDLTRIENYFAAKRPDYSHYDPSKIFFFGSINGTYMHEVVERDYFSEHHPGLFYNTFRSKF